MLKNFYSFVFLQFSDGEEKSNSLPKLPSKKAHRYSMDSSSSCSMCYNDEAPPLPPRTGLVLSILTFPSVISFSHEEEKVLV